MHLELTFETEGGTALRLPRANLNILQAAIYSFLSEDLATFLHDQGFVLGERHFKFFTFSWLCGQGKILPAGDHLGFTPPLSLVVASPLRHFLEEVAACPAAHPQLRLGNQRLSCTGVRVRHHRASGGRIVVRTLSPITCYSSLQRPDGHPYTAYHEPAEPIFSALVSANLEQKYRALFDAPAPGAVTCRPVGKPRLQVARFSSRDSFPIKGWWGTFVLEGPDDLLQLALDAGCGAKSSLGWGCVEPCGAREREGGHDDGVSRRSAAPRGDGGDGRSARQFP